MFINENIKSLRCAMERAAKLVVSCKYCTSCCENGLVYIFDEEVPIMQALDVPLVNIKGVHYIQRKIGGSCPMLNSKNQGCSIYPDRPFCCRLYPLDVFNRSGKLEWGFYTFCPEKKKKAGAMVTAEGASNHGLVLQALRMIENILGEERMKYLAYEDLVSAEYELLDQFRNEYVILGDLITQFSQYISPAIIDNISDRSCLKRNYV
ncbi:MAG: YkgJ family cysteine cluster protein [Proteobacteria bacterium]|nr:YkgJ family cysteine cluster protein [Pseudomonadota bacterium]